MLEYLKSNGGNVSEAARVFGINRPVIYDILRKEGERTETFESSGFSELPRAPAEKLAE